ncbi:MAG: Ig-like domain-containing protein, partial [Vicinamibacterales bacterium]|nr:Ig-like domain-containing protein [Vicinamibacterales bacterium]
QYVDLVFPARGDEQPDDDWIVTQVVELNGLRVLNPVDTAKFKQGRIVTSSPPCPGVLAAGVYGAMKSGTEVGINYSQVYNQYGTQWPMRVETSFVPAGFVPLPFVYLVPETVPQACYPVLSGRATVVANGVRVRISGDQLSPRDREVIVVNTARGTTQRFPRNVVELTLEMTGSAADSFAVKVNGPGGEQAVTSLVISASPQADTVVFRLDMDLIGVPVETVTITNLTRTIERVYNVGLVPFEVGVAGGAGDGYQVEVVNATGQRRTVAHEALDGPYGDGNFLLKVKDGTIDPNAAEAPPGVPGRVRQRVRLTSTGGLDLVVPDDRIVLGGIKYAFEAPQADEFRLTVEYVDGTSSSVRIPSFRLTVTNPQTGRVIRTIIAPAPPKDEPLELAPISDDVRPPMVISGPTRVNSFDPAGVLEFRFSESMNAASIANLANFIVRDAAGQQVLGEFRVSDLNRRITFIPAAPLRLGAEYTVTLKGNDSLSQLLEPGQGTGMTDRSGNALPTLRLTLKTFKPRLVGTYGSNFSIKDPVVRTRTVEAPGGSQRKTYVVATTSGAGDEDKVIAIDVTSPESPARAGGSSAKAPTRQWITVLEGASFTRRDGATFTGDLAFASTFNTFYTFGDWYDVTDPATPRHLGGKIFTTNPDNVTGFNSQGTLKILGFGKGVAMLPTSQGVTSYIAIEKVGIAAANTSENVPERGAQDRILEPYYQGDFTDVVTHGAQLVALERSARRLEVLSADLAPTASVDLPDVPRRVRTLTGLAVDIDQDGLITPDEQFDLAVVGAEGAVLLVDLGAVDTPRVLSRIPLPGVTARSLDVDVERRRLFVADFSRVFMIDLSRPTQEFSTDADGDGYDDRVIWHAASSANGVAMDVDRGLVYVTTNSGLDIWAVYDNCCDLAIEVTARRGERQVGDRNELLAKERLALQTGIAGGLQAGSCGAVSILEQGSGACLWKPDPASACGENYQPGVSDHDFEVFFTDTSQPAIDQCIDALTAQFIDPVTGEPKDIALSSGGTMRFEDISFFPMPKAEFEAARLNIEPPRNSRGTDTTGDLGLGRQQLLLKWLLEGEYIDVPGSPVFGRPLAEILEILKSQTRIPRSEGYEWATLMAFNLAKSKAYLRIAGATSSDSVFHDFSVKQLHDAGKAGIRATLARMVADGAGSAFVLDVTRDAYDTSACRAITPLVSDPTQWAPKPCGSFEEYVASAAARSLVAVPALNLFTKAQVLNEVHRFFRVKSDLERIGSDTQADEFIRSVHHFVARVLAATEPAFGGEPDQARRQQNVDDARAKTLAALAATKVHVVPVASNRGFRGGNDLLVQFFEQTPGGQAARKGETRVSLAGGDRQELAFVRRPDGSIETDAEGRAVPLFTLGPVDVRQQPGQLGHVAFTIDL